MMAKAMNESNDYAGSSALEKKRSLRGNPSMLGESETVIWNDNFNKKHIKGNQLIDESLNYTERTEEGSHSGNLEFLMQSDNTNEIYVEGRKLMDDILIYPEGTNEGNHTGTINMLKMQFQKMDTTANYIPLAHEIQDIEDTINVLTTQIENIDSAEEAQEIGVSVQGQLQQLNKDLDTLKSTFEPQSPNVQSNDYIENIKKGVSRDPVRKLQSEELLQPERHLQSDRQLQIESDDPSAFYVNIPDMSDQDLAKVLNWIQAETTSARTPMCWKDSYGRGVGEPLSTCPAGKEKIGALCYTKCPSGFKRFGFDCHSTCPVGFRDDGLFCRLAEYGRGAGYPWKFGDSLNNSGSLRRCRHINGDCEIWGAVAYPKCRNGYHPFGCCICRPHKPNCASYNLNTGIDLSCGKKIIIGDPTPMQCPSHLEQDVALCYPKCREGFHGIGPVCWSNCDKVDCGAMCAQSATDCVSGTFSEILSVAVVAANIATMGLTSEAGEFIEAETKVGKAFVKVVKTLQKVKTEEAAVTEGAHIVKKVYDSKFGKVVKTVVETAVTLGPKVFKDIEDYRHKYAEDFAQQTTPEIEAIIDKHFIKETADYIKGKWAESTLRDMAEKANFDWNFAQTALSFVSLDDITGVFSLISSFTKPICQVITPFPDISAAHHNLDLVQTSDIQQKTCYNLKFTTFNGQDDASMGTFEIDGYGPVPRICHDFPGSSCDIQVCNVDSLVIHDLSGNDGWKFAVSGDVESMSNPKEVLLDGVGNDPKVEFALTRSCYNLNLITQMDEQSESSSDFEIEGYGLIPKSCHTRLGDTCNLEICNVDSLVIHDLSEGDDGWKFAVTGNVETFDSVWLKGKNAKVEFELIEDGLVNLALDGVASMSSTHSSIISAENAIDGIIGGHTAHTKAEYEPWWKVDLQELHTISKIIIWNRIDCCKSRLSNTSVYILDESEAVVERKEIGDASTEDKFEFSFDNVTGKTVKLQIQGRSDYLNIAQVMVFGSSYFQSLYYEWDSKNWNQSIYKWIFVDQSAKILQLRDDNPKISLNFKWKDQGWGNRKGNFRIRLWNEENKETKATYQIGKAPHDWEDVVEVFESDHPLIANVQIGDTYVIEVYVGGGGGHKLNIDDFALDIPFASDV